MGLLYFIADAMHILVYYVVGYRRKVVLNNLQNSFPEKDIKEISLISKGFYRRFMDFTVETLKALSISEEALTARVKFINVQDVQPYADANQSILVLASHQFNWEWALLTGCIVLPFPVDAVYQKLLNKKFDRLMVKTRARFGGLPIEKNNIIRAVIKNPKRLRAIGMVSDQSPRKKSTKYWTNFLNQDTAFFLGPQQIAKVAKFPVFFFKIKRPKRGFYEVELVKLADPPYGKGDDHSILEAYARETEKLVREEPSGYLWSHKRWKLKRE